jgi:peptide/nickel transport system ATP-binding protein
MAETILSVRDLVTEFVGERGSVRAVDGVSFELRSGEILGLVGESGSGKSVTGFSIMGLVEKPGRIASGSVAFKGRNLVGLDPAALRALRGDRIAMIFQDPMMTLNPVLRIDTQMIETVLAHRNIGEKAARDQSRAALARVGIPSPDDRLRSYPHQLSGGMRQRVAIAIALLHAPDLIIADEPTTALDVTIQAQILYEVQKLARETGTALIWISHDLAVVSALADRIAVMYAGRIVEEGDVQAVLTRPLHRYTAGLLASIPSQTPHGEKLRAIPGMTPSLANLPAGCPFRPRCGFADDACGTRPALVQRAPGRLAACIHPALEAAS